mmetsp:Transcript_27437/g.33942  ORF Transcript_27437/g.33942 Transcript_27437/m.33942 type:complete len:461 (+) Transcript_27437:137-1519(+)
MAEKQKLPPPHKRLSYLTPSPPLQGQTLYLGGELGPDNNIYCIPGHAKKVLAIYPNYSSDRNEMEKEEEKCIQIGPTFEGKFKWLRGIKACNDIIYGLPCHADSILRIDARDPSNVKITTIPIPYKSFYTSEEESQKEQNMIWKYHGGAISPIDDCIYCIPQSASHVLKIDPKFKNGDGEEKEILSFVGPCLPGKYKWYGGVVGPSDGAIYGIPQNSGSVLRIHPTANGDNVSVTLHGDLGSGLHQWHGGAVSSDGTVVCIPNNASNVLLIKPPIITDDNCNNLNNDVESPQLQIIGGSDIIATGNNAGRIDRKYKYLGATSDEESNVYCFPSGAERVLRINTKTLIVDEIGPSLYESKLERLKQNKWQNGFYSKIDNCIYAIPLAAETVLSIDLNGHNCSAVGGNKPIVGTMRLPLDQLGGLAKWEGGVMASNGNMYCMPNNFKRVLKITPRLFKSLNS